MDHPFATLFPSLIIIVFVLLITSTRLCVSNELSQCCAGGSRHLRENGNCQSLRAAGSSPTCARAASICCLRALIDASCQAGVLYAQRHKMCSTVVINELAGGSKRECCDCCLLARELSLRGEQCVPPIGFSPDCLNSFNKCCNRTAEGASAQQAPSPLNPPYQSVSVPIGPDNRDPTCASAKCEHLCSPREDGSVQCSCRSGYDLASDGRACVDIDECLLLVDDCLESQRCLNTPGGYKCIRTQSCGTGYAMDSETEQCVDVDECTLGAHDCGPMYQCRNTQGSFRCVPKRCALDEVMDPASGECKSMECPTGYKAVEGRCEDIDECRQEGHRRCAVFEECVNTPGGFRCQEQGNVCSNGYYMDKDSGFCLDTDECQRGSHTCDSAAQCINLPGTYRCNCAPGFEFNEISMLCEDVDECVKFGGHACSLQAQCLNTPGSYECKCKPGFKLGADNRSCEDIDECANGVARCQQKCINSPGSYQCICERGYQLGIDELTCEDIDECSIWAKSGNELCMGQCVNIPGSFTCTCPIGYEIMPDGITCKDIDECRNTERNLCATDHLCINLLGSYRCQRIECPRNYFPDRNYKNRCVKRPGYCENLALDRCKKLPIHISWQHIAIPKQINISQHRTSITLFSMKGPADPNSSMQFELRLDSVQTELDSVIPATRSNFLLQKGDDRNSAIIALRDSLDGPQEVHLELVLRLSSGGVFSGKYVANLWVFVSQHKPQPHHPNIHQQSRKKHRRRRRHFWVLIGNRRDDSLIEFP